MHQSKIYMELMLENVIFSLSESENLSPDFNYRHSSYSDQHEK